MNYHQCHGTLLCRDLIDDTVRKIRSYVDGKIETKSHHWQMMHLSLYKMQGHSIILFLFIWESQRLPSTGSLSKCLWQLGGARSKVRARNPIWGSHSGGRHPISHPITCHLPGFTLTGSKNLECSGTWTYLLQNDIWWHLKHEVKYLPSHQITSKTSYSNSFESYTYVKHKTKNSHIGKKRKGVN